MSLRILVLKTKKLSDFLTQWSKLFHSIMVDQKKWKGWILSLEGECYVYFERVKLASDSNQAKEIFKILIFQDLKRFSTLTSMSKGLQFKFLKDFFLQHTLYCSCLAYTCFTLRRF